jgi:hypothetical protein
MDEETWIKDFEPWLKENFGNDVRMLEAWIESARRADRQAREECAGICSDVAYQHIHKGKTYGDRVLGAIDCEHRIRETIK